MLNHNDILKKHKESMRPVVKLDPERVQEIVAKLERKLSKFIIFPDGPVTTY